MAEKLLKPTQLETLRKTPGRHADGGGLFLEVRESRASVGEDAKPKPKAFAASWLVRMQAGGKRRDFGLGSLDKVPLATARDKRDAIREQFAAGIDPVLERKKAAGLPTFQKVAEQLHKERLKGWSNGKHRDQWIATLRTYAFPKMGAVAIDEVERGHILDVLTPIWLEKPETARRVKQRIGAVLDWAYGKGWREAEAPTRALAKALPKNDAGAGHFTALAYADMPGFMADLRNREGMGALALEALILTAARSGEIRLATWGELDLDAGLWSIPAARMKRKRAHVVPLSSAALAAFQRAKALRTDDADLVFPGLSPKKPLSDATLAAVLKRMGQDAVPHGFRSSFKDWAGEVGGFPNELSEAALAHAIANKAEAAYRRGDLLERRRVMMEAWARYCDGAAAGGNVVPMVAA
ncbi:site-specific integrase [Sandarakinorhabdus sp.]|uniref:tyrosine-type recombinase/integrase n=1 Tax=Sandarakinorhabdus sp. TaxID=1916663 RepID=UPI003342774E